MHASPHGRIGRGLAAVLVAAMIGSGCALPPRTSPGSPAVPPEYRVAPPDSLGITVRPAPEIARDLVVRPDGKISMDLIGDVHVQGRTIEEIRQEIQRRLKEFVVHPDVTVVLSASNSRRYYVLGEVERPGGYPLIGEVDALDAIATAGGLTRFASKGAVRLVRPGETGEAYRIDFDAITQNGFAATNHPVQPGDVIYAPPNASARIGYALGVIFFPIQQIIGLGGQFVRPRL